MKQKVNKFSGNSGFWEALTRANVKTPLSELENESLKLQSIQDSFLNGYRKKRLNNEQKEKLLQVNKILNDYKYHRKHIEKLKNMYETKY